MNVETPPLPWVTTATNVDTKRLPDDTMDAIAASPEMSATFAAARTEAVFNILNYGARGDGDSSPATLTANKNAIIAARNAAAAWNPGTGFGTIHGAVYIPGGVYFTNGDITWKTGVGCRGDGMGRSVLRPQGIDAGARMFYIGSETNDLNAPLTDATFSDFEIDGIDQQVTGSYNTGAKGFHGKWLKRVLFNRVLVRNTAASGFGVDHHSGVKFTDCYAISCGRLNDGSKPGGAGFGIGSGAYAVEDVVLHGCTSTNNGTFGVFFETQDAPNDNAAFGAKIVGSHFEANQVANIANAGVTGMMITGCSLVGGLNGMLIGPRLTDHIGHDITISSTQIQGATNHGIHLDYRFEGNPGTGSTRMGLKIDSSVIVHDNGQSGINIVSRLGQVLRDITINATAYDNGWSGVRFAGEGTVAQFQVGGMHYNNGRAGSSTSQAGVQFACNVSYGSVRGATFSNTSTTQLYGVDYVSGITATQVNIIGNNFDEQATPIRSSGATRVTCKWINNTGYNTPVYSSVAITASPMAIAGTNERPRDLYIIGGTVSQIQVDGQAIATSNPGTTTIHLEPHQSASITYSVAPIAVKQYLT